VAWLCRQLGVARSGFYAWRQRQHNPGSRARENEAITAQVQAVFDRHRGFYGAPRVHQELRSAGLKVGRHRIARLMRCSALKAKTRRGFWRFSKIGLVCFPIIPAGQGIFLL
jgi:putative transposase